MQKGRRKPAFLLREGMVVRRHLRTGCGFDREPEGVSFESTAVGCATVSALGPPGSRVGLAFKRSRRQIA